MLQLPLPPQPAWTSSFYRTLQRSKGWRWYSSPVAPPILKQDWQRPWNCLWNLLQVYVSLWLNSCQSENYVGGNFPEIPFTEVLKVFYLQFTELLSDLENKSGFAARAVVVARAPAKLLRKKRKEKKNVCQQARLPGIIATAFNYLTPRRIYFHDCLSLINRMFYLFQVDVLPIVRMFYLSLTAYQVSLRTCSNTT